MQSKAVSEGHIMLCNLCLLCSYPHMPYMTSVRLRLHSLFLWVSASRCMSAGGVRSPSLLGILGFALGLDSVNFHLSHR